MNETDELTNHRDKSNQYRVWKHIPERLKNDPMYMKWRSFLLHTIPYDYDFHLTVTFQRLQHDEIVIQSTSHFLNVINSYLTSQRFRKTGRYMEGFAFLERHMKSIDREGGLHVHILGYFPDTFYKKPTIDEFETKVNQATDRVTNPRGYKIIFPSSVKVRQPYLERGIVSYLSKYLTPENLDERILFVGKDGLTGWQPDLNHPMNYYGKSNKLWSPAYPQSDVRLIAGGNTD
ncbi:hypothetical protein ACFL00_03070 [Pseudomonadota bacterium]